VSRRLVAGVLAAAIVVVAACVGDDDDAARPEDAPASSSSAVTSSSASAGAGWCDELTALLEAEGDITTAEIAGAPDEIAAELSTLVEASADDELGKLLAAFATVEAWGHERCGRDHPFCSLWITFNGAVAAAALTDDVSEDVQAELRETVDEMDDVLLDHVPPDERAPLQLVLASLDDPGLSDMGERAAEAAYDALDEWAWSEGCEGASEPHEDD